MTRLNLIYFGISTLIFLIFLILTLINKTRNLKYLGYALVLGLVVSVIGLYEVLNTEYELSPISLPMFMFAVQFSFTGFMHYFILQQFCDRTGEKVLSISFFSAILLSSVSIVYVIAMRSIWWELTLILNAFHGIYIYTTILIDHQHLIGSLRFYGVAIMLLAHTLSFTIFFNELIFIIAIFGFIIGLTMVFASFLGLYQ